MLLAGLTGGIGAGKSTVADMLVERGAVLVDGDRVAREVVEPGQPALARIAERFGPTVLDSEGRLDRPALAALAFADDRSRRDLEAITHPAIQAEFARRVLAAAPDAVVVLDVPLLVESGKANERGYHCVIVVEAPRDLRLERLERRGVERVDAEARMAAQASDGQRRKIATWVLHNDGDLADLERQVDTVWADLVARNAALSGDDA
ncbi:MAG: dephospho-CoA kinase [Acidimicrobiia bacterium]